MRSDVLIALHLLVQAALIVRVLLRPHRDPASRIAWVVVVLAVPFLGIAAYLMLGETSIGARRARRLKRVMAALPDPASIPGYAASAIDCEREETPAVFRVGRSISGYAPVGGNRARLMANSAAAIDAMIRDIEAAADHVHLLFYIWLPDRNGTRMARALIAAARRNVTCRAMVDDIGSRALIRSALWGEMRAAGVRVARALPVGNPVLRVFNGRIDLRNHRKILVVDNRITYCGSQNCADAEFLPKARYGPWVDLVMRFDGPVARQNQHLFAGDWTMWTGEDLRDVLLEPMADSSLGASPAPGLGSVAQVVAQVVATGPTARFSAAPEMFETLMYAARRRLFVTTPYYVPVESLQAALTAAAYRGVETTIIFPARNDDFAVAAASRSYYADLLAAGVRIHEYRAGLLHAKSVTVDDEITFIGSANMDRRSFELNYENNILLLDRAATAAMLARQRSYLAECTPVRPEDVAAWGWHRRLWNNGMAIVGPVL